MMLFTNNIFYEITTFYKFNKIIILFFFIEHTFDDYYFQYHFK